MKINKYTHLKIFLFIFFFITSGFIFPQVNSNLQILNSLVDSSANTIVKENNLKGKAVCLDKNLPPVFTLFSNQLSFSLNKAGVILQKDTALCIKLGYTITEAKVKYDNLFRDGFLGNYYIERNFNLTGNYLINGSKGKLTTFTIDFKDTVEYGNLKNYENPSLPFTQGEIPAEPFWSSFYEPAIAIGSAAVAVYLFFSIRSK